MGFLKDMSNWLSGGKNKDTVRSATIKLKVFNKRLMRQTKRMEITAKQARDKAVRLRKAGDMDGSAFHARNYLQVKIKDISNIMTGIAASLGALKSQLSVPQLTEMMTEIGIDMEDFEVTQEITSDGIDSMTLDTAVSDSQVKDILGE
ncbi:MAG: hypothetical protein ACTSQU_17535, partial [Promethearchaeota archaeon]